jgi:Domain of unknown function (DUF4397)
MPRASKSSARAVYRKNEMNVQLATRMLSMAVAVCLCNCGGGNPSTSASGSNGNGQSAARFIEGAPELEALVGGVPTDIGLAYLSVNGTTIASSFPYSSVTSYSSFPAGTLSLSALDSLGYSVGPIKTTSPLEGGKKYTVVLLGAYPDYRAVVYEDPPVSTSAQLSVYEASPSVSSADFGKFAASNQSHFVRLGSVTFGHVATAAVGKSVTDFGGYAGKGTKPFANGALTLEQVDSFDKQNVLPFHAANRLSLFVIDVKAGSTNGPVLGTLDQ